MPAPAPAPAPGACLYVLEVPPFLVILHGQLCVTRLASGAPRGGNRDRQWKRGHGSGSQPANKDTCIRGTSQHLGSADIAGGGAGVGAVGYEGQRSSAACGQVDETVGAGGSVGGGGRAGMAGNAVQQTGAAAAACAKSGGDVSARANALLYLEIRRGLQHRWEATAGCPLQTSRLTHRWWRCRWCCLWCCQWCCRGCLQCCRVGSFWQMLPRQCACRIGWPDMLAGLRLELSEYGRSGSLHARTPAPGVWARAEAPADRLVTGSRGCMLMHVAEHSMWCPKSARHKALQERQHPCTHIRRCNHYVGVSCRTVAFQQ